MTETRTRNKYQVTLHWRSGEVETCFGWGTSQYAAAADAMNSMGYGGGVLAALDYWEADLARQEESLDAPSK